MLGLEGYFSEEPQVYHIGGWVLMPAKVMGRFGPETETGARSP